MRNSRSENCASVGPKSTSNACDGQSGNPKADICSLVLLAKGSWSTSSEKVEPICRELFRLSRQKKTLVQAFNSQADRSFRRTITFTLAGPGLERCFRLRLVKISKQRGRM